MRLFYLLFFLFSFVCSNTVFSSSSSSSASLMGSNEEVFSFNPLRLTEVCSYGDDIDPMVVELLRNPIFTDEFVEEFSANGDDIDSMVVKLLGSLIFTNEFVDEFSANVSLNAQGARTHRELAIKCGRFYSETILDLNRTQILLNKIAMHPLGNIGDDAVDLLERGRVNLLTFVYQLMNDDRNFILPFGEESVGQLAYLDAVQDVAFMIFDHYRDGMFNYFLRTRNIEGAKRILMDDVSAVKRDRQYERYTKRRKSVFTVRHFIDFAALAGGCIKR